MIPFWLIFLIFVGFVLLLDLGVFNKNDHVIGVKEAIRWTILWILVSLAFNVGIYFLYEYGLTEGPKGPVEGYEAALEYLTGYVIEKSLSLDNIFVMAAIFGYFKIPQIYQHRVLFWGILGAIILRGIFILGGTALILHFEWIMYVFGVVLIFSAAKMLFGKENDETDLEKNGVVRFCKKFLPVTTKIEGHAFIIKENGKRFITPLFMALIVIESSDVLFAVDSIPAIFAVTLDPFIVFTSNIMAVLGLRSLCFALAAMLTKFSKLKYAIIFILAFVGVKMLVADFWNFSTIESLGIISAALLAGILASVKNFSK